MNKKGLRNVVFLDRDGVINRDSPEYIKGWSEFEFLPGSLQALVALTRAGFESIIITNQSAVNRGLISVSDLKELHQNMQQAVRSQGGRIRDIFFCPHQPQEGCSCRKPKPGMIEQACSKYGIDPKETTMVGDSTKDIECARNAGCGSTVLVRTGNGEKAFRELNAKGVPIDYLASHLSDAAQWIIRRGTGRSDGA